MVDGRASDVWRILHQIRLTLLLPIMPYVHLSSFLDEVELPPRFRPVSQVTAAATARHVAQFMAGNPSADSDYFVPPFTIYVHPGEIGKIPPGYYTLQPHLSRMHVAADPKLTAHPIIWKHQTRRTSFHFTITKGTEPGSQDRDVLLLTLRSGSRKRDSAGTDYAQVVRLSHVLSSPTDLMMQSCHSLARDANAFQHVRISMFSPEDRHAVPAPHSLLSAQRCAYAQDELDDASSDISEYTDVPDSVREAAEDESLHMDHESCFQPPDSLVSRQDESTAVMCRYGAWLRDMGFREPFCRAVPTAMDIYEAPQHLFYPPGVDTSVAVLRPADPGVASCPLETSIIEVDYDPDDAEDQQENADQQEYEDQQEHEDQQENPSVVRLDSLPPIGNWVTVRINLKKMIRSFVETDLALVGGVELATSRLSADNLDGVHRFMENLIVSRYSHVAEMIANMFGDFHPHLHSMFHKAGRLHECQQAFTSLSDPAHWTSHFRLLFRSLKAPAHDTGMYELVPTSHPLSPLLLRFAVAGDRRQGKKGRLCERLPSLISFRLPFVLLEEFLESFIKGIPDATTPQGEGRVPVSVANIMQPLLSPPTIKGQHRSPSSASIYFPWRLPYSDDTRAAKRHLDRLLDSRIAPLALGELYVPYKGKSNSTLSNPFIVSSIQVSLFFSYPVVTDDSVVAPMARIPHNSFHDMRRLCNVVTDNDVQSLPVFTSIPLLTSMVSIQTLLRDWSTNCVLSHSVPEFQAKFYESAESSDGGARDRLEALAKQYYEETRHSQPTSSWKSSHWQQSWRGSRHQGWDSSSHYDRWDYHDSQRSWSHGDWAHDPSQHSWDPPSRGHSSSSRHGHGRAATGSSGRPTWRPKPP